MELFKKLLTSRKKISSYFQRLGPENAVNAVELLIKLDDKEMLKYFINVFVNKPKEFEYA